MEPSRIQNPQDRPQSCSQRGKCGGRRVDRSQHRRPDSVSAGPRSRCAFGRNARAGLAECCRLAAWTAS